MKSSLAAASFVALASIVGCYTGAAIDPGADMANAAPTTSSAGSAITGLPCEVAQVVLDHCAGCHGATPRSGAESSLVRLEDFKAGSKADPSKSVGEAAVARMRDAKNPMPTDGILPEADVAAVEKWVAGGMKAGTCDGLGPAAPNPEYSVPAQCTSGAFTRGDRGRELMHPGGACIDCHTREREGRRYAVAGTVYATAHEPNDCNGASGSASKAVVIVTDANGRETSLAVNSTGNFYSTTAFAAPYKVKVVVGNKVRAMAEPPPHGDCNLCHTQDGNQDAPGRILLPK